MKFTFVTMVDRTFSPRVRMNQNTWIYKTRREAILNLPRDLFEETYLSQNYWCEWDEDDEPGNSSYIIGSDGMLSFTIKTVELEEWKTGYSDSQDVTIKINQGEPEYDVRDMGMPTRPPRLDPFRVLPGDEQFTVENTWGIRQAI